MLDFLSTPCKLPSFLDFTKDDKNTWEHWEKLVHAAQAKAPAPIRCLFTKSFFLELERIRTTIIPEFSTLFGTSPGTSNHDLYQQAFVQYFDQLQDALKTYVEEALLTAHLLPPAIEALEDMENKLLWLYKAPFPVLSTAVINLQTQVPLLTPGLINIITNMLEENKLALAEVSFIQPLLYLLQN